MSAERPKVSATGRNPVIIVTGPFCSEAVTLPLLRVINPVTSPTNCWGTETPILYTGSERIGWAVRKDPQKALLIAGMICAGPRCTGSSCSFASKSFTLTPRIGSSERGPFLAAHLKPELTVSFTSRRYWIPFVMSTRTFLCSSKVHTFLASLADHPASSRKVVLIRFFPIASKSSPFSIRSITFWSRGSTWTQNLLCLLGLFAMATTPVPAMLSL